MYNLDGTPNYSSSCVVAGPSGPICYSSDTVAAAYNVPSIQNVEVRGFLSKGTDGVPATNGYYDDEYHFELVLDVGWTQSPGTFALNTAQRVSQYLPAQNLIFYTPNNIPLQQSQYGNSVWGGYAAVALHAEANSWGSAKGAGWSTRIPSGWFHVGQSGDAGHNDLWWPFNLQAIPMASGGTASLPASVGNYIQLIGTLWRDGDHYPARDKPSTTNQGLSCQRDHGGGDYWLEIHGVDSMAFASPPAIRHTLVGYSICTDSGNISMSNDQDLWSQKPTPTSYVASVTPYYSGQGLVSNPSSSVSGSSSVVTFGMSTSGAANEKAIFDVQWAIGTCAQTSRPSGTCQRL